MGSQGQKPGGTHAQRPAAKRSYPTSEVRGSGREYQTATVQDGRKELPRVRGWGGGGGAAERRYLASEVRGGDERSYPASKIRGAAKRRYPASEIRGRDERSYPVSEVRGGGSEEQPHA